MSWGAKAVGDPDSGLVWSAGCCTRTRCGHWDTQREVLVQDSSWDTQKEVLVKDSSLLWERECLKLSWSPVDIPCLDAWRCVRWLLSLWQLWRVKVDWNMEVIWHSRKAAVLGYQAVPELGINLPSWYIPSFSNDPYKEMKVSLFRLLRSGRSSLDAMRLDWVMLSCKCPCGTGDR